MRKLSFFTAFVLPFFIFTSPVFADNQPWHLVDHPNKNVSSQLNSVITFSSANVWVLGNVFDASDPSFFEHWDGSQWNIVQAAQNNPAITSLGGIGGSSTNDIWAVGNGSQSYSDPSYPLINHWNGTSWSVVSGDSNFGTGILNAVSASSPSNVWVGGGSGAGNGTPTIEHWDGSTWQITPSYQPPGPSQIARMYALSPNDVWAVGFYTENSHSYSFTEHWDGTAWGNVPIQVPNGTEVNLSSISGTGTNDVWVSGIAGTPNTDGGLDYTSSKTLVEHWDGSNWSIVSTPNPSTGTNDLYSISAISPTDVWAAGGTGGDSSYYTQKSLIEHWDGTHWSVISTPDPGPNYDDLFGISADQQGNVVSVGVSGDTSDNTLILATGSSFIGGSSPTTLTPTADSYIKQGSQNENEGASTFLRLQSSGHNRALIKFDESQIQAAVGASTNYTAKLQFTITNNGNNWGTNGRTIELHRLFQDWVEGNGFIVGNTPSNRGTGAGVTWNCSTDSDIHNQNDDCSGSTAWNMTTASLWPFASIASATTNIINNQTGTVSFDVTSDVQSFLNGTNQNYGWLLKKTDEGANGNVEFGSKESSNTPQLIITKN